MQRRHVTHTCRQSHQHQQRQRQRQLLQPRQNHNHGHAVVNVAAINISFSKTVSIKIQHANINAPLMWNIRKINFLTARNLCLKIKVFSFKSCVFSFLSLFLYSIIRLAFVWKRKLWNRSFHLFIKSNDTQ